MSSDNPITLDFGGNKAYEQIQLYLLATEKAGIEYVIRAINKIAFLWQREIRRHAPVDSGLYRSSINVIEAKPGQTIIQAVVGTNEPYAIYLEFGSDKQRGYMMQVARWNPGDPPVTRWYAKDGPLALLLDNRDRAKDTAGKFTTALNSSPLLKSRNRAHVDELGLIESKRDKAVAKYQRLVKQVEKGFGGDTEEFGPPMRASWDRIAEQAVKMMLDEVAKLIERGKL